jgi:predicted kinase
MTRHSVIVVSGLPGSGKSTLAEALATEFAAALLSKDVIEAALWRRGVGRDQDSFWISHEIITTLARDAARRCQPVIIDTVATTEDVRRDWRDLARGARCAFIVVLCVCSNEGVHRSRLGDRRRGIEGWPELEWSDVERVALRFEPWVDEHLTIDAMNSPDENLAAAATFIRDAQVRASAAS